jgi:N-acetylglucosamine kinase-like BadF-type ATPase
MSSSLVLGVDGGGTSTTAWVAECDGTAVGKASAGPSNVKTVGHEIAQGNLQHAVSLALRQAGIGEGLIDVACFGLAGFDRPDDKELLKQWTSTWARRSLFVNDGDLVVAAGTPEGWGVGVISGTGSIAVGRAPDGRTSRAGGWGPLIGDEGSGYAVALSALRIIARRHDGRDAMRNDDPLSQRLCQALGISNPSQIPTAIYSNGTDRASIAALAPVVAAVADEDAEVFSKILKPAAYDLAETVAAAARALGWENGTLPLALAGGFLLNTPTVLRSLLLRLGILGYEVTAARVEDPVRGAVILARRAVRP